MKSHILIAILLCIVGVALIGIGAGLGIFPALVTGILLLGIGGALYVISLFQTEHRPTRNTQPVLVV